MFSHCFQSLLLFIGLSLGLPETYLTNLVKDQIATFKNKFLLPLATYSRNAQPYKNFLGKHDLSDVLGVQSDVKLDLLFALNVFMKSILEDIY